MGTFLYMAPEAMVSPRDVDERIDVFSIGCILYRILAGTPPFSGATPGEISYQVLNADPAPLPAHAPRTLADLALRSLSRERESRPDVQTVRNAVHAALGDGYHAAHERLTAFINGNAAAGPPVGGAAGRQVVRARGAARPGRRRTIFLAAGIAVAGAALALSVASVARQRRAAQTGGGVSALPALKAMRAADQPRRPAAASPASSSENPTPLSSETPELATGRLALDNVQPGDSVWINGRTVSGRTGARGLEFTLEPGHYRIEIRAASGARHTREVDMLPYQNLRVGTDAERSRDDAKRRR